MSFLGRVVQDLTTECETKILEDVDTYGVFYRDVFLWTHPYPVNPNKITGYKIAMVDEGGDDGVKIIGKVPVVYNMEDMDYAHYGYWETEAEAINWLRNPVIFEGKSSKYSDILLDLLRALDTEKQ